MTPHDKQAAFDLVAQIVSEYAAQWIVGGNPAPDSEACLRHLELVADRWGYSTVRIREHVDMIAEQNAYIYEMEGGHDC